MTGVLRLQDFLPYRLSIASNAVSRLVARAYQERFGLTVPEWRLVAVLKEHAGSTQQDLVRLTLMDKVAVSRAAAGLEQRGLIRRASSEADGRAWLLSLTDSGDALHAQVAPVAMSYEKRLLEDLNPDEAKQLAALLRRIETAAARLDATS
jgi:DNA-binding MarR family transcriptional regulator